MSGPELRVGRRVVAEMVRLAVVEVPGVFRIGRSGPRMLAWLAGPPVAIRLRDGRVTVRVSLIARPAQALVPLTGQVRAAVGGAVERLLGLEAADVTVVVDGVGS